MAAFVLRRTVADRGTKNVWANNHQGKASEKSFPYVFPHVKKVSFQEYVFSQGTIIIPITIIVHVLVLQGFQLTALCSIPNNPFHSIHSIF